MDGGLELPLKMVQARLGHASIQMTADTYGHLFPRSDDGSELAAAEKAFLRAKGAWKHMGNGMEKVTFSATFFVTPVAASLVRMTRHPVRSTDIRRACAGSGAGGVEAELVLKDIRSRDN